MIQVRVWDWPTRIFHWVLALLVVALVITGNVVGNAMVWHFRCGYGVLSLLLFRLLWGFVGGHWSRWRQLTCTPSAEIGKALVLLLVATHVLAIGWHFFKKQENLTRAMLLGDKTSDVSSPSSQDGVGQWLKALVCLGISSGLVYLLITAVPSP